MTRKAVVELQLSIPRRFLYQGHMGSAIHMRMNAAARGRQAEDSRVGFGADDFLDELV